MRVFALAVSTTGLGCPGIEVSQVPTECKALAAKCKLPSGPLGVCDQVACAEGQGGPCFRCMPQH